MTQDQSSWKSELLFTGNIVQDSDRSVSDEERAARSERYLELLEAIDGTEGVGAARAIIESIQAEDDYGAYQCTQTALGRFPNHIYLQALVDELPALISRQHEWAAELLCGIANAEESEYHSMFRDRLANAPVEDQSAIRAFIKAEESEGGWLEYRAGLLV